jgi:REP element-mobilizing transposase RayT
MARLDAPGTLHHVIVRGIEERRIVDDRMDREKFVSRMGGSASITGTLIYAWALMGNHAHVLLRSGPVGLAPFMRRFLRQKIARHLVEHFGLPLAEVARELGVTTSGISRAISGNARHKSSQ